MPCEQQWNQIHQTLLGSETYINFRLKWQGTLPEVCLHRKRSHMSQTKYQATKRSFRIWDAQKMGWEQKGWPFSSCPIFCTFCSCSIFHAFSKCKNSSQPDISFGSYGNTCYTGKPEVGPRWKLVWNHKNESKILACFRELSDCRDAKLRLKNWSLEDHQVSSLFKVEHHRFNNKNVSYIQTCFNTTTKRQPKYVWKCISYRLSSNWPGDLVSHYPENAFKIREHWPQEGTWNFKWRRWLNGAKSQDPKKIPRASSKTPKKSHADFVALKSSRKG